jgi:hypothetical protein
MTSIDPQTTPPHVVEVRRERGSTGWVVAGIVAVVAIVAVAFMISTRPASPTQDQIQQAQDQGLLDLVLGVQSTLQSGAQQAQMAAEQSARDAASAAAAAERSTAQSAANAADAASNAADRATDRNDAATAPAQPQTLN